MIKVNRARIPSTAFIHESTYIECDYFEVGEHSYIGPNNKITCKSFKTGDYFYMTEGVEVGRGGCTGPDSEVTIGDNVGIGTECLIWTHGAWLDITEGFPADFGPVSIGSNVWFPARSILMPNTNIGDNCVIGSTSVVTRDIPSGSLAMGTPCKVVREEYYPQKVDIHKLASEIVYVWKSKLVPHKGIEDVDISIEEHIIKITHNSEETLFNLKDKTITGNTNIVSEDFRDYLRRRGVKIYNGLPFKSIQPSYVRSLSKL